MGVEITGPGPLLPGDDMWGNGLAGVETFDRGLMNNQGQVTTSGSMRLVYFTPAASHTATTAITYVGSTPAGATPTLCKVGFYTVDEAGDLTLVASTANTTSMWSGGAATEYAVALSASYTFLAGQRYAAAVLVVTGATAPNLCGCSGPVTSVLGARAPRIQGTVTGQSDLPASVSAGSVTNAATRPYIAAV